MAEVVQAARPPVVDTRVRRVCDLSGLSQAKASLATLTDLRKSIDVSLADLAAASGRERTANAMLASLLFIRATCDAFVGMAAALSSAAGADEETVRFTRTGISLVEIAVDTIVRKAMGEKVDWVNTATDAAKKGADLIGDKPIRYLAKNTAGKVEIGVAAVRGDNKRVTSKAKDYARDLSKYTLDALKDGKKGDRDSAVGAAKAYIDVAKEAFSYNDALARIADDLVASNEEAEERLKAARAAFSRQARTVQTAIDRLQDLLAACGAMAVPSVPGPR